MKLKFSLSGSAKTPEDSSDEIYHSCDTSNFRTLLDFIAQTNLLSECEEASLRVSVDNKDVKEFLHMWQDYLSKEKPNA